MDLRRLRQKWKQWAKRFEFNLKDSRGPNKPQMPVRSTFTLLISIFWGGCWIVVGFVITLASAGILIPFGLSCWLIGGIPFGIWVSRRIKGESTYSS